VTLDPSGRGRARNPRIGRRRGQGEGGQATVELALTIPFIGLLLLGIVQVGLVVRDQVLVVHAAREAARAAAVHSDAASAEAAALAGSGLSSGRLTVVRGERGPPGSTVSVTVRYRTPTAVPLVGALLGDVDLSATAAMRVEG
jgi:Flp pilus assembly protein TadG